MQPPGPLLCGERAMQWPNRQLSLSPSQPYLILYIDVCPFGLYHLDRDPNGTEEVTKAMQTGKSTPPQEAPRDPVSAARIRLAEALVEMHAALVALVKAEINVTRRGIADGKLTVRVAEAAKILGISKQTVYRMARDGELTFLQIGGVACVRVRDLERLEEGEGVGVKWAPPTGAPRRR